MFLGTHKQNSIQTSESLDKILIKENSIIQGGSVLVRPRHLDQSKLDYLKGHETQ
jgi:hypothetical protein